jgi:hypothetical protein
VDWCVGEICEIAWLYKHITDLINQATTRPYLPPTVQALHYAIYQEVNSHYQFSAEMEAHLHKNENARLHICYSSIVEQLNKMKWLAIILEAVHHHSLVGG